MRDEKEMMKLIMKVAVEDERIRGVYMNGSRTNVNAPADIFQDYDIVYVVKNTKPFIEEENWIDIFGKRLYMQLPDQMSADLSHPCNFEESYGYLMQLADGNRLDLQIKSEEAAGKDIISDALCRILLDKDKQFPEIPPANDRHRWVVRPGKAEYLSCCNEFWWLFNNVGKGLWRKEIPYVMDMIDVYIRPELVQMISWEIGTRTDFSCSVGKMGKYMNRYLPEETYCRVLATYRGGDEKTIWEAVCVMTELFGEMARKVGAYFGYEYNGREEHFSRLFLEASYYLPEDAREINTIRRIWPEDAAVLAELWYGANVDAHDFIKAGYWKEHYDLVKEALSKSEGFVYEDIDGVKGFLGISGGHIEGLFVRKEERGRGIGHALLSVSKKACQQLTLHVYCRNERAVRFYEREGFAAVLTKPDDKTGEMEQEMIWKREV